MNTKVLEGKWKELRDKAQNRWGRLTTSDLQQIGGHREALEDKLRERYGLTIDEASNQVDNFLDETGTRATEMQEELQHQMDDKREMLQNRIDEARQKAQKKAGEYDAKLEEMQPEDMAQAIRSKPFFFVALAALGGVVIGLWFKAMKS